MILVTGAGGMIGSHMVNHFAEEGDEVVGTFWKPTTDITEINGRVQLQECDVRDSGRVDAVICSNKPRWIFHLAAQSYPAVSWEKPLETMAINCGGTINIFEAVRRVRSLDSSYDPVVVVACSSAEYGSSLEMSVGPVDESIPLLPLHPYGVSKVAQDLLSYQYYVSYGIRSVRARIFNSTGARKRGDVCSDFVRRVVACERRGDSSIEIEVGNLETRRAIMDVRDTVAALIALAEFGKAGEAYNISSKNIYRIGDIVSMLGAITGHQIKTVPSPSLYRPTDEKIICGNSQRLMNDTGWHQRYTLEDTLRSMLDYERHK